jgi:hypothetical protein
LKYVKVPTSLELNPHMGFTIIPRKVIRAKVFGGCVRL